MPQLRHEQISHLIDAGCMGGYIGVTWGYIGVTLEVGVTLVLRWGYVAHLANLAVIGGYWRLLAVIGGYWRLLAVIVCYWRLSTVLLDLATILLREKLVTCRHEA